MNFRKYLLEIAYILLCGCICIACIHLHRANIVQPELDTTEPPITHLDLSGVPLESLELFDHYPQLEYIDLSGTGLSAGEYDILREKYPHCQIIWDIPFQGAIYPQDTTSLTVTGLTDEDVALLDHLPLLEHVFAWDCTDYDQLVALQQRHPGCTVYYKVSGPDKIYSHRTTRIAAPGNDPEAIARMIPYLPELKTVTLEHPLAEGDRLKALLDAYPDIAFHWELDFCGITVGTDTTELDLSGIPMTVDEIEAILPYMPNLTRLDMSHCGISNEEMDALNRRHEKVKIVWTVYIGNLAVKTDATWFMPAKYYAEVTTYDVYNLRYCTDMECIDLGHMEVSNCEFAAFMPHLKYLMLADTNISDLTPLTGLTELVYLELFMTPVSDYTPLTTLTSLEDLNLYFTYGDGQVLAQMTWLKNLWWRRVNATDDEIKALTEALPNTHVECSYSSSTGNGWRQLPNYYAQRDIFGMEYMTE